jgi:hypothetical protein
VISKPASAAPTINHTGESPSGSRSPRANTASKMNFIGHGARSWSPVVTNAAMKVNPMRGPWPLRSGRKATKDLRSVGSDKADIKRGRFILRTFPK